VEGPPADRQEQPPTLEGVIQSAVELKPGDRVIYPNQGVCQVVGLDQKDIAGQRLELVKMTREEDGAAVMVPTGKVPAIGLRRVASGGQIEGVFHYLGASYDDPELDWKVRHRDNVDRLVTGGVLGVAEVVKGLHALSRIRPLPTKEREQYDNARHLLVHEVAVSLGVPPTVAEDYIDYALLPPAGVQFKLKPPPKPVQLPIHPYRLQRRPVAAPAGEEDLGIADLDLDLGELGVTAAAGDEAVEAGAVEGVGATDEGAVASESAAGVAPPLEEVTTAEKPRPPRARKPAKAAVRKSASRKSTSRKAAPRKPAAKKKASSKKPAKGMRK
jgi:CarD family transcriptional regulator